MTPTIFFSWQSDSDRKFNRNFLSGHIKHITEHLKLKDTYEYDEATRGLPGTPDIPSSIFSKLENAAVAIFDVTIVKKLKGQKGLINSNVALG